MNIAPPAILNSNDPCSPLSIATSNTAVLLLDFHGFIAANQPNGEAAIAKASSLRDWAEEHDIMIIQCLIDLRTTTPNDQKMASKVNGARTKTNLGRAKEAQPVISPRGGEFTFWRPPSCVSAMESYGIRDFLRHYAIKSLVLAGFSTSGCVINTAKSAADKGFVVSVVKDACGDRSTDLHDVVVDKLLVGQAHVMACADLVDAWKGMSKEVAFRDSTVVGTK